MPTLKEVLTEWDRGRPDGGWGSESRKLDSLRGMLTDDRMIRLLIAGEAGWPTEGPVTAGERVAIEESAEVLVPLIEAFAAAIANKADLVERLLRVPGITAEEADHWAASKGRDKRRPPALESLIEQLDEGAGQWDEYRRAGTVPSDLLQQANRVGCDAAALEFMAARGVIGSVLALSDTDLVAVIRDVAQCRDTALTASQLRGAVVAELQKLGSQKPPVQPDDLGHFIRQVARLQIDPDDFDGPVRELLDLWASEGVRWAKAAVKGERGRRREVLAEDLYSQAQLKVLEALRRMHLGVERRRSIRALARVVLKNAWKDYREAEYIKEDGPDGRRWLPYESTDAAESASKDDGETRSPGGPPRRRVLVDDVPWHFPGHLHDAEAATRAALDIAEHGVHGPERVTAEREQRSAEAVDEMARRIAWALADVGRKLPHLVSDEVLAWAKSEVVVTPQQAQLRGRNAPAESARDFLTYLPHEFQSRGRTMTYEKNPGQILLDMARACHAWLSREGKRIGRERIERAFAAAYEVIGQSARAEDLGRPDDG